ncbi:MAG: hypothetical protein JWQ23_4471 [Herminiimonas sp.]|nr:hypothetical protein [Herminiimonas sp.]MDB5949085.1 hypothetical protein [Massilia sp.]
MLKSTLNPDGTIALAIGDESISLSARELDEQIACLAHLREQLADKVPMDPPQVEIVAVNPGYAVRIDHLTKASLLRLRHAGYGWLNFELPPQDALQMKSMWTEIVNKLGLEPPEEYYDGPERRRSNAH